ncbi:hypothetical protein RRG08_026006 [Elysia crispata]|uniref:Uncharacterized protein n=1 Tax=Elysia crispata TaxID=231223 RepID=A0AAE1B7G9_9GAST|nr:hypothetical protein RRG08_026006 [Elysia crispata]
MLPLLTVFVVGFVPLAAVPLGVYQSEDQGTIRVRIREPSEIPNTQEDRVSGPALHKNLFPEGRHSSWETVRLVLAGHYRLLYIVLDPEGLETSM